MYGVLLFRNVREGQLAGSVTVAASIAHRRHGTRHIRRARTIRYRSSPASSIPVGRRASNVRGGCTNHLATMGRMHSKGYA